MTNFRKAYEFISDKQAQKDYNDEIVRKTWHYQNKYGFQTSSKKGNEFWNNEADAFKHAYMSADLSLKNGDQYSLWAGMYHEYQTPKNPPLEWNMDSWNNNQGREIAKEIRKEYGDKFMNFTKQKQEDIIAAKVVYRMRNGDLITNPTDPREYNGKIEKQLNKHPEIFKEGEKIFNIGQTTGQATNIEHIFTPEEIGNMTPEEFSRNESLIMAQMKAGIIGENSNNAKMYLINSPNTVLYTREDIGNMSTKEYEKHEDAINRQLKTIGIPSNKDVPKGTKTYGKEKSSRNSSSSSSEDGRWVTINGNHVFIED